MQPPAPQPPLPHTATSPHVPLHHLPSPHTGPPHHHLPPHLVHHRSTQKRNPFALPRSCPPTSAFFSLQQPIGHNLHQLLVLPVRLARSLLALWVFMSLFRLYEFLQLVLGRVQVLDRVDQPVHFYTLPVSHNRPTSRRASQNLPAIRLSSSRFIASCRVNGCGYCGVKVTVCDIVNSTEGTVRFSLDIRLFPILLEPCQNDSP